VFLAADAGGVRAFGYPHSIGLRAGTLLLDERLRALAADRDRLRELSGSRRGYGYTFAGLSAAGLSATGPSATGPSATGPSATGHAATGASPARLPNALAPRGEATLFFAPEELAQLLGTRCARDGELGGIVVTSFDADAPLPYWERLPDTAAADVLARHRHRYYDNAQPFWNDVVLPAASGRQDGALTGTLADALRQASLSGVRIWHLTANRQLRRTWEQFSDLVAVPQRAPA
jgi:hypothetical protein